MSASDFNSAIYISDTPAQIKNKIKKHAFSGGGATQEEHEKFGGNPDVDVSFQYLKFFLEDDEQLAEIEKNYRSGSLSTSSLKQKCIELMTTIVLDFQQKRSLVNEDLVKQFMDPNAPRNIELDFSNININ
jgi:tryptophanyl-tRNA synthetase